MSKPKDHYLRVAITDPKRDVKDFAADLDAYFGGPGVYEVKELSPDLIAAAPDMLEVLEIWLHCHDNPGGPYKTPPDDAFAEPVRTVLKQARAAIAKAKGTA